MKSEHRYSGYFGGFMRNKNNAEFTKQMRKTHTIYMPQMLHYHNELLCAAFRYGGYRLKVVPEHQQFCKQTYSLVGKDYCTCAFGIVGNILTFVQELGDKTENIAFLEPQAGGACRAGNYYNLIIDSLHKIGKGHIPVLSLNAHGEEAHSGFSINPKMLFGAIAAVCYGDLLMTLTQQIRPYEVREGQTEQLRRKWVIKLSKDIASGRHIFGRKKIYHQIARSFLKIKVDKSRKKTKVGIVGEIYIKFSPVGNFHLEDMLYKNNCEIRQGGFINYCAYVVYSEMMNTTIHNQNPIIKAGYSCVMKYLYALQKGVNDTLKAYHLKYDMDFRGMLKLKGDILDDHYNIGDGWLMAAESMDLARQGYNKVLIVHPFGCLVSHVGGRGIIKELTKRYPGTTVSSIEFDIDQSATLRESRIMLAIY